MAKDPCHLESLVSVECVHKLGVQIERYGLAAGVGLPTRARMYPCSLIGRPEFGCGRELPQPACLRISVRSINRVCYGLASPYPHVSALADGRTRF